MSSTVIVDTSIVIKWMIEEPDSDAAVALLARWINEGTVILAPVLLAYEITNVLYQRIRKGLLTVAEAEQALAYVLSNTVEIDVPPDYALNIRATQLAYEYSLSAAYDAHYLALAEREHCEYWTADLKLLNATNKKLSWVKNLRDSLTQPSDEEKDSAS